MCKLIKPAEFPIANRFGGGHWFLQSREQDMERRVLGGRAQRASVHGGVARAAEAQVPARQQQHARLALAASPARRRRRLGCRSVVAGGGLETAGPRVLGVAVSIRSGGGHGSARGLQKLVECSLEARSDCLVALGDAYPRLTLGANLGEPL